MTNNRNINRVIFVPNHFLIAIFAVFLTTPEGRKTKFTLGTIKIFSHLGLSLLLLVLLQIVMLLPMIYMNDMNEDDRKNVKTQKRQTKEFSVKNIMSVINVYIFFAIMFNVSFCCILCDY